MAQIYSIFVLLVGSFVYAGERVSQPAGQELRQRKVTIPQKNQEQQKISYKKVVTDTTTPPANSANIPADRCIVS